MKLKLHFLLLFVAFACHIAVYSATIPDSDIIDSLRKELDSSKGQQRADLYNKLSWNSVYSNTNMAIDYARSALILSGQLKYKEGESMALNRIGVAYDVLSKYDSALRYYYKALTLNKQINNAGLIAGNLCNIGLTNWNIGNSNEASRYFFSALSYFEKDNNIRGIASTYNNIGLVHKSLNNYTKAAVFFNKSLDNYIKLNDKPGIAAVLTNLGQIFTLKREFNKSLEYLSQSLIIKEKIEDYYGLSITYNLLASLFMEKYDFHKALEYSKESAKYALLIDDDNELAESYLKTAIIRIRMKEFETALKFNRDAERIAVKIKSNKLLYDVYHNYADIFEALGDYRRSLEYYKRYRNTEDSVKNNHRFNQIYELELKHETDKSNAEIATLNRQKRFQLLQIEAQQLIISKRNNQILFIITGSLVILLICYIFYNNYRYKQKANLEEAIYQIKEQRANEVIEAELRERKRIGEELHDGMGQVLSVLKLTLTSLQRRITADQSKQQELVVTAVELTDNAFNELRNISHNLAPIFLKQKGIATSIRTLLDRLSESKKFKVNMDFSSIDRFTDSYTELTIYRVVQEILNNIIVHSSATEINFQFLQSENELMLMIEDNGVGFDINEDIAKKGIGLRNINSRIENIGGKVHIDSVINRGTIITIIIPQNQSKNEKVQVTVGR